MKPDNLTCRTSCPDDLYSQNRLAPRQQTSTVPRPVTLTPHALASTLHELTTRPDAGSTRCKWQLAASQTYKDQVTTHDVMSIGRTCCCNDVTLIAKCLLHDFDVSEATVLNTSITWLRSRAINSSSCSTATPYTADDDTCNVSNS